MSNPLDDAFAKAQSERALQSQIRRSAEQAEKLAVRDWVQAYREILAAAPRYVRREPEETVLAWPSEDEPPSSVEPAGVGKDHRGSPLAFGSCDAWRFTKDLGEKTRVEFFVSADCALIFETADFTRVRTGGWGSRSGTSAHLLGPFVDVRTGRHALRLHVSSGSGDTPYHVWDSNLPRPEFVAEVIAKQELKRQP